MNSDNIRSYAVGHKGYEVMALVWLDGWVVELSPGRMLKDDDGRVALFKSLPEAIEAGKAYLLANGGEVYSDGDDKDKRIEELEGLLKEVLDNEDYCRGENAENLPRDLESRIKKAMEVKR